MVQYSLGSMISGLNGPISQLPLAQATLSPPLWRNMSTSSSQAVMWFHLAIVWATKHSFCRKLLLIKEDHAGCSGSIDTVFETHTLRED